MKSKIVLLFFLCSFMNCQAQGIDPVESREQLLAGVDKIATGGGVPGPLFIFSENAFPVFIHEQNIAIAAAVWGEGRLMAFGHGSYFNDEALEKEGNKQFLANSFAWLSGKEDPSILVLNRKNLADFLSTQNYNVKHLDGGTTLNEDLLESADILWIDEGALTKGGDRDDFETIKKFITSGKSIIIAGLGWGWLQLNPGKSLKTEFKGNILLREVGINWANGYVRTEELKAKIDISDFFNYASALKYIKSNDYQTADKTQYAIALNSALKGIPLVGEMPFAINTDFPGNVPSNAAKVSKKINIDTKIPYWHSTGLYAAPGAKITVNVPASAIKFSCRIGAHTDQTYQAESAKDNGWLRAPELSIKYELVNGENVVFNPFGGLIYIEVPEKANSTNFTITISGGVEAPYFKLGETSLADWTSTIRNNPAPWGEIESKELVITVRSAYLKNLDNPEEVAKFWDRVQDANRKLSNWKAERPHYMRIVFDRQISAGYMHSGYPVMAIINKPEDGYGDEEKNIIDIKSKEKWGFFHELGHNHQESDWTFEGTGEVTCNLFTLYAFEKVMGLKYYDASDGFKPESIKKYWDEYLKTGKSSEKWKSEPFLALIMYIQLVDEYGWESFENVFVEYQQLKEEERPKNDDQKRDLWLKMYSNEVGENLSDFFDEWNVPVSTAAKASLKNLPKANLEELMKLQ